MWACPRRSGSPKRSETSRCEFSDTIRANGFGEDSSARGSRSPRLSSDKCGHLRHRIEVIRPDLLLLDFQSEVALKKFDQLDHAERVDDSFAEKRGIVGIGKAFFAIQKP